MRELTMKLAANQDWRAEAANYLKTQCKADFDNAAKELVVYRQENRLSDQDFRFFFSTLLAHYMGCLVETEFETRMAKWTDRLFSHWARY